MSGINIGDIAPQFTSKDSFGSEVSLANFSGKRVVLYFYPKDMTPGCTNQACSLRDHIKELQGANVYVLGVSFDSEKRHQKFIEKQNLPSSDEGFTLLSDEEKEVANLYGVYQEKKMCGKTYMGIVRTTFLIGEDGKISHIFKKPKVKEHAEEILAWLDENV